MLEDEEFLYKLEAPVPQEFLQTSMTSLQMLLQIHSRLQDVALPQFQSCYQFVTSMPIWEQLLSESCKKDFARYF